MRLFILIFTGFIAPILLVALLVTNPLDFGGGKGLSPSQNDSNVEIVASIDGINITRDEIDRAAEDNFETLIQVPEAQQAFFSLKPGCNSENCRTKCHIRRHSK